MISSITNILHCPEHPILLTLLPSHCLHLHLPQPTHLLPLLLRILEYVEQNHRHVDPSLILLDKTPQL